MEHSDNKYKNDMVLEFMSFIMKM